MYETQLIIVFQCVLYTAQQFVVNCHLARDVLCLNKSKQQNPLRELEQALEALLLPSELRQFLLHCWVH